MSYNIAADLFKGPPLTRMSSYFVASFSIAPPLGIFISELIFERWGFKSIFIFLTLYSAFLFLLTLHLPETLPKKNMKALHLLNIIQKYNNTAKNGRLILGSFILGSAVAIVYLLGSEVPFISEDIIGLSPKVFGTMALIPYFGMLLGGVICFAASNHFKDSTLLLWGTAIFLVSSLAMLLFFSLGIVTTTSLYFPLWGAFLSVGIISSSIINLSMSHMKDKSYTASVLNFIANALCVIAVLVLAKLASLSILAFPFTLLGFAILALLLTLMLNRNHKQKRSKHV